MSTLLELTEEQLAELAARLAPFLQRPEWVSVEEAARRRGIKPAAMRRRLRNGQAEGKLEGSRWRVLEGGTDDLAATPQMGDVTKLGKDLRSEA